MVKAQSSEESITGDAYRTSANVEENDWPKPEYIEPVKSYDSSPLYHYRCIKCGQRNFKIRYCAGWREPLSKEEWQRFKKTLNPAEVFHISSSTAWNLQFKCIIPLEHLHVSCDVCGFAYGAYKCADYV